MLVRDLLLQIREPWLDRLAHQLARGEGVRDTLVQELSRFYELLMQAVDTGDPDWLKPLIIDWAQSRTETDLRDQPITLSPILSEVFLQTCAIARGQLTPEEALGLIEAIIPIFTYSYEQIAQQETLVRIGYISSELEQVHQRLERLERTKSDFIAVAAHELKTPLTLIEGYTSMLQEQLSPKDGDSSHALLLKGVGNGIRRLTEIVDDMVDVSVIDNNLLSLSFQPTWIHRSLKLLAEELRPAVTERSQTLEIRDFPGSDEMTFADSERIHQAFRNVLVNAIKYTPDGGSIIVDGRKLSGFIEITVTDTGIGIDPEDQARIFEKFGLLGDISLHSTSKTKFKGGGAGLGLPIAKGILTAHGGTIWVESPGEDEEKLPGSTFHILVPLRSRPPDEQMAKIFEPLTEKKE